MKKIIIFAFALFSLLNCNIFTITNLNNRIDIDNFVKELDDFIKAFKRLFKENSILKAKLSNYENSNNKDFYKEEVSKLATNKKMLFRLRDSMLANGIQLPDGINQFITALKTMNFNDVNYINITCLNNLKILRDISLQAGYAIPQDISDYITRLIYEYDNNQGYNYPPISQMK